MAARLGLDNTRLPQHHCFKLFHGSGISTIGLLSCLVASRWTRLADAPTLPLFRGGVEPTILGAQRSYIREALIPVGRISQRSSETNISLTSNLITNQSNTSNLIHNVAKHSREAMGTSH